MQIPQELLSPTLKEWMEHKEKTGEFQPWVRLHEWVLEGLALWEIAPMHERLWALALLLQENSRMALALAMAQQRDEPQP